MMRISHPVLLVLVLSAATLCVPCDGASRDGWRRPDLGHA